MPSAVMLHIGVEGRV